MADNELRPIIIKKKKVIAGGGHHGGAWKVAMTSLSLVR
jgi:chemotaxis protein MotB